MPIYEYECECCDLRFELRRDFDDNVEAACPQCGRKARRIFLPVPVIFKGSGFYVTDSRDSHGSPSDKGGAAKSGTGKGSGK